MKSYLNNQCFKIEKKIYHKIKKIHQNKLLMNLIINYLIYLNLKFENFLHNKKTKIRPNYFLLNEMKIFNEYIDAVIKFKNFSDNTKYSSLNFSKEKKHNNLFNKLWTNYSFDEYKKERLGRYIKRIKLNKLNNIIKNKKIVDFGCGHGNFLISCSIFGAKECIGIDFGKDSIGYAKKILNKFKKKLKFKTKVKFYCRSVYNSKLKKNYFNLAIQNGVFHHLKNENKAYKEVYRVLEPNGYFWVYTIGGGCVKDFVQKFTQKILNNINNDDKINFIRKINLSTNKQYFLGDTFSAEYNITDINLIKKKLKKIGFRFVKQLNGYYPTDFDLPTKKINFFRERFGAGDLRLLFQK